LNEIAAQISTAEGPSGPNVDYIFKLADFMKTELSHVRDKHLFQLKSAVKAILNKKTLANIIVLMKLNE